MKRIEHKIKRLLCTVLLLGSLSAFAQTVQVLGGDKPQLQCVTEKDYQDYMRPAIEKILQDCARKVNFTLMLLQKWEVK